MWAHVEASLQSLCRCLFFVVTPSWLVKSLTNQRHQSIKEWREYSLVYLACCLLFFFRITQYIGRHSQQTGTLWTHAQMQWMNGDYIDALRYAPKDASLLVLDHTRSSLQLVAQRMVNSQSVSPFRHESNFCKGRNLTGQILVVLFVDSLLGLAPCMLSVLWISSGLFNLLSYGNGITQLRQVSWFFNHSTVGRSKASFTSTNLFFLGGGGGTWSLNLFHSSLGNIRIDIWISLLYFLSFSLMLELNAEQCRDSRTAQSH